MQTNYVLWKSKTFWTMVIIFIINGYSAISGQVPSGYDFIINIILTALASYFHLQTGKSVSGTN